MSNRTVLIDQIMGDPRFPQLAGHLWEALPTGMRDQIQAATKHTFDGMNLISEAAGGKVVGAPHSGVPEWIRLGAIDALLAHCAGTATTCMHDPSPATPQPLLAAAWKPGYVVCGRCIHLLTAKNAVADATCDGCGHVCAGVEVDDGIYPLTIQLGPLIYRLGVCENCRPAGPLGGEEPR